MRDEVSREMGELLRGMERSYKARPLFVTNVTRNRCVWPWRCC